MRKWIVVLALAAYVVGGVVVMRNLATSAPRTHAVAATTKSAKKEPNAQSATSLAEPLGIITDASVTLGEVSVGGENPHAARASLEQDLAKLRALPAKAKVGAEEAALKAAEAAVGNAAATRHALTTFGKLARTMDKAGARGGHNSSTKVVPA